jgi:hypothetical protein
MKVLMALIIAVLVGGLMWFSLLADNSSEPTVTPDAESLPVISRQQILHATDLVAGVKKAVAQNNDAEIDKWLNKAIELAKTAELAQQDISYLQSETAKNYVIFHAKRSLFNDAFEQAYYAIEDIEPLKADYPQAQDLFEKADKLIMTRNQLIQQLAAELSQGQAVTDQHLQEAKKLWQQRFVNP